MAQRRLLTNLWPTRATIDWEMTTPTLSGILGDGGQRIGAGLSARRTGPDLSKPDGGVNGSCWVHNPRTWYAAGDRCAGSVAVVG